MERRKQLQERVPLSPLFFLSLLQKGEKEDQYKPAKSSLMHLTFQKKINSNFTPTGCVAQLCQNVGIIKEEMTWLEGAKSLPPPSWGPSEEELAGSTEAPALSAFHRGLGSLLLALEIVRAVQQPW